MIEILICLFVYVNVRQVEATWLSGGIYGIVQILLDHILDLYHAIWNLKQILNFSIIIRRFWDDL